MAKFGEKLSLLTAIVLREPDKPPVPAFDATGSPAGEWQGTKKRLRQEARSSRTIERGTFLESFPLLAVD